jgi:molecular chaperone GrpE
MDDDIRSAVADNSDSPSAEQDSSTERSSPGLAAVTDERDQLLMAKAELQDRMLRLQAEFDNFRRRMDRERMEFAEYAGMETIRGLLSIVDDFERALSNAPETATTGDEFVKGIQLIYNRLTDTLKKQGVEVIEAAQGVSFDPHLHHAVQKVPTDDAEEGTILEVFQRGYNFKGKLLRPAMVSVASKA